MLSRIGTSTRYLIRPQHSLQCRSASSASRPASVISMEERCERRDVLVDRLKPNSLAVVPANSTCIMSNDIPFRFRQSSLMEYFAGFPEPDSLLFLRSDHSRKLVGSALAVLPKDKHRELWDGFRIGPSKAAEMCHVDLAVSNDESSLKTLIAKVGEGAKHLYFPMDALPAAQSKLQLLQRCLGLAPLNLHLVSDALRVRKSSAEVSVLTEAASIGCDGMIAAMAQSASASTEWDVDADIEYVFRRSGARGHAYPPVVACGRNALTLHYIENSQPLELDKLLLIDAGAEYSFYNSDITRTFPVGQQFSEAQAEVYQAVLTVQKLCMAAINTRESNSMLALNSLAMQLLSHELRNLGVLTAGGPGIMDLMPHSIGHHLGLDVHDVRTMSSTLAFADGHVVTCEPGVYIPAHDAIPSKYHNIGIRIEDDIVITADGSINLTHRAPKEIADIEELKSIAQQHSASMSK